MSETNDSDHRETGKQNSINWNKVLCAIGLFIVALMALPPLPPWFGTLTAALAILAALFLLGVLPFPQGKGEQFPEPLRGGAPQWNRAAVFLALLAVAILLLLAIPPHLRLLAIFTIALAGVAVLGWFPKLRAELRRWLGRDVVGKPDGDVCNSDAESGPSPNKS